MRARGPRRHPAALLLCGHEAAAKAMPSYQQTAILLVDNGFAALIASYLRAGRAVLLADLRGLGETADPPAFNEPKYQNRKYRPALLALQSGPRCPTSARPTC